MDYTTLSAADRLLLARDALRGRESDHFRLSLLNDESSGGPQRLLVIEQEIDRMKTTVRALEREADKEAKALAKKGRESKSKRLTANDPAPKDPDAAKHTKTDGD